MTSPDNTKLIPLTQGKHAIVDAADYEWLAQWKWSADKARDTYYARTRINGHHMRLHRLLLGDPKSMQIDHINGNPLDNRRCNLRICLNKENSRNCKKRGNRSSKYKGVSWWKRNSCWRVQITVDYVNYHIGYFPTEITAAKAYNAAALEHFGEFARLNAIDS